MNILSSILGTNKDASATTDNPSSTTTMSAETPAAAPAAPAAAAAAAETPAAAPQTAPAAAAGASEPKPDESLKVFAGNLAFATSDADLKSIFASAGNVTAAQVVTRGTRSLGYGFVTFSTAAEAQAAVSQLNGKEIEGRKINVEAVKPESQGGGAKGKAAGGAAAANGGAARTRAPRGAAGGARRPRKDEGEEETGADGERKPAAARTRKPRGAANKLGTPAGGEAPNVNGTSAAGITTDGTPSGGRTTTARAPRPAGAARKPSAPKGAPEGQPSQTLLFVANLPFEINTDELLRGVFDGFKVNTAKVALNLPRRRSKGYGFVDFETHEEQQRALKECQGKSVEGREISIKIAIEDEKRKQAKIGVDGTPAAGEASDKEEAPAAKEEAAPAPAA